MSTPSRAEVWRLVAGPFLCAKALSLLVPILFLWSDSGSDQQGFVSGSAVRDGFMHWDGESYVHIANTGYPVSVTDHFAYLDAFLPGYPLLMRLFTVTGIDVVVAGVVISAIAELIALFFVARLVTLERDTDSARFAVWAFALWPLAHFLTVVYTESTFLACAAAALYLARRGSIWPAAAVAALSCTVRVTGAALAIAIGVEVLRRSRFRPSWEWMAVVLIPLPLVMFGVYMRLHTGDALAYVRAQTHGFNHTAATPWEGFWRTAQQLTSTTSAHNTYIFGLEVLFGVGGFLICVALLIWRPLPLSLTLYCVAVWLTATSISFWLSVPRYELAMFPVLIVVADLTRRHPQWRTGLIAASAGLMSYGAVLFSSGRWLG